MHNLTKLLAHAPSVYVHTAAPGKSLSMKEFCLSIKNCCSATLKFTNGYTIMLSKSLMHIYCTLRSSILRLVSTLALESKTL